MSPGTLVKRLRVYLDRTRQRQIDSVSIVYFFDATRPVWMLRLIKFQIERVVFYAVILTLTRPVWIDPKSPPDVLVVFLTANEV